MKAFRYLLIVALTVITISVSAQFRAEQPKAVLHSTSSCLVSSGSTLPQAAQTGVVLAGSTPYTPTTTPYFSGRRKVGEGGGWADEDDTEGEGDNPSSLNLPTEPMPIGNGLWILLALAGVYAVLKARRRKALNR